MSAINRLTLNCYGTYLGDRAMSLQLKIDYPETLPDAMQLTREQFEQEAIAILTVMRHSQFLLFYTAYNRIV